LKQAVLIYSMISSLSLYKIIYAMYNESKKRVIQNEQFCIASSCFASWWSSQNVGI